MRSNGFSQRRSHRTGPASGCSRRTASRTVAAVVTSLLILLVLQPSSASIIAVSTAPPRNFTKQAIPSPIPSPTSGSDPPRPSTASAGDPTSPPLANRSDPLPPTLAKSIDSPPDFLAKDSGPAQSFPTTPSGPLPPSLTNGIGSLPTSPTTDGNDTKSPSLANSSDPMPSSFVNSSGSLPPFPTTDGNDPVPSLGNDSDYLSWVTDSSYLAYDISDPAIDSSDPVIDGDPTPHPDGPEPLPPGALASIAVGGILISFLILVFSGIPAATIWRSSHLHKNSYLYVLALCVVDCAVGASILIQVLAPLLLLLTRGAVPGLVCIATEALATCSVNAVSLLMMALAQDRLVSLQHPLRYPVLVPRSAVCRHVRLAAAYGAGHALLFIVARLGAGHAHRQFGYCNTLDWLLEPRHRLMAGLTVLANVALDSCTVFYNGKVLYYASRRRAVAPHTSIDSLKQAAVRKQTKIFLFTFKLTCLFVGCSLPYKAFMLFHALGADVPRSLFNLLGFIRSLYHIIDGWTFCLNAELYETMRLMLGCGG